MTRRILAAAVCGLAALWATHRGHAADEPAGEPAADAVAGDEALVEARSRLLRGNYTEAAEQFEALAAEQPIEAAIGRALAQRATGEIAEARATLQAAVAALADDDKSPAAARLLTEAGVLNFDVGDYAAAEQHVADALARVPDHLPARWLRAELHRVQGRVAEADAECLAIVEHYNAHDVADAESLLAVAQAAAQHARWNRLKDDFRSVVNELLPAALAADENCWQAHCVAGLLFLEKYNQAEASRAFKEALEINANAAEVFAALARLHLQNYDLDAANLAVARALEINPRLADAHRAKADALAANFQMTEAIAALEGAVELNPASEATLGRLAAAYLTVDGVAADGAGTRYANVRDEVLARNAACGEFFYTLAEQLTERRKFGAGEQFYQEAIARMPQMVGPRAGLGMLYMRLGREPEAEKLLQESFAEDPFNVRVKNTLEVLDVLAGYAVLETEHFVIKFDRAQDELLARYAAKYLEEEVYPELTRQFAFEPEGKSLFEIFNRARNTSGHGWFSARMVGLPYIGTVGACAGRMVALTSPNSLEQKFNWAQVLKHEFVHVLNLQQTNFNIPHWFTEALAVRNENAPRPQPWNELLRRRVPAGETFHLDDINLGFIRPQSGDDWNMAYCQAELYAEHMVNTYGDDALAKMLSAYADNLDTRAALQRSFGVEQEAFESSYREFLGQVVADLAAGAPQEELTFAQLQQAYDADPENADLAARLAAAHLARRAYPQARKLAEAAQQRSPGLPRAGYVLARVHLVVGETEEAIAELTACLDERAPDADVLSLLASLRLKGGDAAEAARLYELAAAKWPLESRWHKGLARVYLTAGDDAKLAPVLARLAEMDVDDATVRKKLLQLSLAAGDFAAAIGWAKQSLHADVLDPDVHRMYAEALVGGGRPAEAIEEYEATIQMRPRDNALRLALARACVAAGDKEQARTVLTELLEREAEYPGAAQLLDELGSE
jgi:predicted Zn-dependent protease